jgi:hypothetical protein
MENIKIPFQLLKSVSVNKEMLDFAVKSGNEDIMKYFIMQMCSQHKNSHHQLCNYFIYNYDNIHIPEKSQPYIDKIYSDHDVNHVVLGDDHTAHVHES